MKKKIQGERGSTLIELMIAASLTTVILTGVYLMWTTMAKSWMTERVKTQLNSDLEVAVTRMKKELRLSSGNEVYYYPSGGSPYTAIAFPIPIDEDKDNLIELDANNNIIWDRTIMYHTYTNADGVVEFRKTTFNPRDNTLTAAQRQEQLDDVAANGDAAGTYNADKATTKTLFSGVKEFEIIPALVTVDGYNSVLAKSDFVSFGSIALTPGNHTLRFEVTGKNGSSSDYRFGIDAIVLSPSGGKREAEELLPPSKSSGDNAENVDLSEVGSWSGYAHLLFHANAVGDYVELQVYHDEWIETNFDNADAVKDGTATKFDTSISPHEIVLYLDGMKETWTADIPTGGSSTAYDANPPSLPSMSDTTLRTIVTKETLSAKGARARVLFRAHPTQHNLQIMSAYIEERSSGQNGVSSTKKQLFFSNTPVIIGTEEDMKTGAVGSGAASITIPAGKEVYSNWADFPIDTQKDYLVTYYISDAGNMYYPSYFPGPATAVNSYYRTGDSANSSTWSTSGTSFSHIVGMAAIQVTHPATGTWTSQIYDTKMDAPVYGNLTFKDQIPINTAVKIYVRASNDEKLADNPAWQSFTSSPSSIPGGVIGRYLQLKDELTTQAPYYDTPLLQRTSVQWPGQQVLVDIGAYFSKDTDYGILKLTVDGQELAKSIEVRMNVSQKYLGRELKSNISSEIEPRNTPK